MIRERVSGTYIRLCCCKVHEIVAQRPGYHAATIAAPSTCIADTNQSAPSWHGRIAICNAIIRLGRKAWKVNQSPLLLRF